MKCASIRSARLLLGGTLLLGLVLGGIFLVGSLTKSAQAAPGDVQELRTQKVGDLHYFHVRLQVPDNLVTDDDRLNRGWWDGPSPSLAPRLVPTSGDLSVVCRRFDPEGRFRDRRDFREDPPFKTTESFKGTERDPGQVKGPRQAVPVRGLEFVGRFDPKAGAIKAKLIYPVPGKPLPIIGRFARTPPPPVWQTVDVVLNFKKGQLVAIPKEAAERTQPLPRDGRAPQPPVRDDLEGLWAVAQVEQFRDLDLEVSDFSFYSFAGTATARKFGVQPSREFWRGGWGWNRPRREFFEGQLYDLTTGATAITESLQLRRMNRLEPRRNEERTVDLKTVQGIDIAEHPWEKMMEGKKPAAEPLAKMIPHDNYYVTFRDPAKLMQFAGLLQQWGGNITRTYQLSARDARLWGRYEQQLCLKSSALAKDIGALGIQGVGITGNDAYLQDGTDITVLLTAANPRGLLTALEPLVGEARKNFGDRLKQSQREYNGVTIESFVTPLREVSLHRAIVNDVVLLSNSPVGLQRVLDTAQGRGKRLSDSLDFQYMRVVFRADDKTEDGFAYLPDAFIRAFVGPASRIKQKRRLEALVSLHMLTHGAMLTAWETGKAPTSTPNLMMTTGLRGEEVPVPDGKPAAWDNEQLAAVSEAYGTIHFATPLVEMEVARVTQTEAEEYRRFRLEYLNLWRQFFDPIGMRLAMNNGQVKLETYILPLIENSAYNNLRFVTGNGTVKFDPASISSKTLFQYLMHLSTDANERGGWFGFGRGGPAGDLGIAAMMAWAVDPVGEWVLFRVDDSPNYEKLVRLAERQANGEPVDIEEVARLVWSLPVAFGADIKNPLTMAAALTALRTSAQLALPGALTWGPLEKEYKGVQIVRVGATPAGRRMLGPLGPDQRQPREPFLPAIYYGMVDGGLYVTLNMETMHSLIDGAVARKNGKGKLVEANTSLHLAPGAAEGSKDLLKRLLEITTHQQARTSLPIWYALYRCGIVTPEAKAEQTADAAYRYLGYVPVSPDGTAYRYEKTTDEVVNERHGSLRKPTLKKTTAEGSPMNQLLETVRSVRADLRFREDGIHTTVTLDLNSDRK